MSDKKECKTCYWNRGQDAIVTCTNVKRKVGTVEYPYCYTRYNNSDNSFTRSYLDHIASTKKDEIKDIYENEKELILKKQAEIDKILNSYSDKIKYIWATIIMIIVYLLTK